MGKRDTEARQCSKTERSLFLLILTTENTQKFSKMQEENWKDLWLPVMPCKRQPSIVKAHAKPMRIRVLRCFGYVFHDTNGQHHGEKIEDPVVPLERKLYGHPLAGLLWERHFEEALSELGWQEIPNWESESRVISVSTCG